MRGAGQNPPAGAAIYYFLKSKPKGELTLEVLDAQERLVRRLSSVPPPKDDDPEAEDDEEARLKKALPTEPGVQRAVWDLRRQSAKKIAGARVDAGDPERGPMAPPGDYTVRISADGRTVTTPLRVVRDPRVSLSEADIQAQDAFTTEMRDDLNAIERLVSQLRTVRGQIAARRSLLEARADARDLVALGERVAVRCDALEGQLHNPKAEVTYDILAQRGGAQLYSRLAPLVAFADEGDGPPTQGMRQVYDDLAAELTKLTGEFHSFLAGDLAKLNAMAKELDLPVVIVPPVKPADGTGGDKARRQD